MLREYAIHKINREMLNKRYGYMDYVLKIKENELMHQVELYKQDYKERTDLFSQKQIEQIKKENKDKRKKIKERHTEALEKLKREISDKWRELELQAEEAKAKDLKIEEFEQWKANYDVPPEQAYNYVNQSQFKFDGYFNLELNDLTQKIQRDSIATLALSKMPSINKINLGNFENNDLKVLNFLKHGFPDSVDLLCLNWDKIANLDIHFFMDNLPGCLSKVSKEVYLRCITMDYWDF